MKKLLPTLGATLIASLLISCSTPAGTGVPTTTTTTTDTSSTTSTGDSSTTTTTTTDSGSTTTGSSSGGAASGGSGSGSGNSGSGGSGSTVNQANLGPFGGHIFMNGTYYKFDFKNDGTVDRYYLSNSSTNEYTKNEIDNFEYSSVETNNFLRITPVKILINGNTLMTASELSATILSGATQAQQQMYSRYFNNYIFAEKTYRVITQTNNGTTYYNLIQYIAENPSTEDVMTKTDLTKYYSSNSTNYSLSGYFDSPSQTNMGLRRLQVNTSNTPKSATMTALTDSIITFSYTPSTTSSGGSSSGTGSSSTAQTLNFSYTKTWANGIVTVTLTPTNEDATTFLGLPSGTTSLELTSSIGMSLTMSN